MRVRAVNQYYVNTEGTITRKGYAVYSLNAAGSTQAEDGMRLERSPYYAAGSLKDLPSPDEFQSNVAVPVARSDHHTWAWAPCQVL